MKTFSKVCLYGLVITSVLACSKEVKVDLDFPTADQYSKVYIPQANHNPILKQISLTDEVYNFGINAFYGGPNKAKNEISVTFEINEDKVEEFNKRYGTSYQIMPEGSYALEKNSVKIESGASSSAILQVNVKGKGFLDPFTSYILPVTIRSTDAPISESLNTVYFEVVGSYAPGEVPREKVLSLGNYYGGLLFSINDDKLMGKNSQGDLLLYEADAAGKYGDAKKIGDGFTVFPNLFYFSPNRIVGVNVDVTQYTLNDNGIPGPTRVIGWGWNIFKNVIPYKDYLIGIRPEGLTTSYQYNELGDLDGSTIKDIATDWNRYKQVIAYNNSLLAIEPDGSLWQIPMSTAGVPGERQQIGQGWDMYQYIIVSGNDLLALDASGDLWRYKFDPKGFWPLKATN